MMPATLTTLDAVIVPNTGGTPAPRNDAASTRGFLTTSDTPTMCMTSADSTTMVDSVIMADAVTIADSEVIADSVTSADSVSMSETVTIAEALAAATHALRGRSDSPRLDAQLLLAKVLGVARSALIARGEEPLAADHRRDFVHLLAQRLARTPVAYLTGVREFWSLSLKVSPAVLVPRPETETLVECALQLLPETQPCAVLDLGTGSGAIALALRHERPRWHITAVDCSEPALAVAAKNAAALQLQGIDWLAGNWFDAVRGAKFDLVVANPPYLAASDPALAELSAEPITALVAGPTGLEALAALAAAAPLHLHSGGWLAMEHGADQAAQVAQLLESHAFTSISSVLDFSGRSRVTLGRFQPPQQI